MSIIEIKAIPRAKRTGVETDAAGRWVVRVHEPPEDGKANEAVLKALADHFGVPRRCVTLLRGATSRHKTVRLEPPPPSRPSTASERRR